MEKLYYSIGEVANMLDVKPYTLRYWEKEFRLYKRKRNGRRVYKKKDINILLLIKDLLYIERYTIDGVRKRFKELKKNKDISIRSALIQIRSKVTEAIGILECENRGVAQSG